jgi:ankyrin repeat protein
MDVVVDVDMEESDSSLDLESMIRGYDSNKVTTDDMIIYLQRHQLVAETQFNVYGKTLLMILTELNRKDRIEVIRYLLQQAWVSIDNKYSTRGINFQDDHGWTALLIACYNDDYSMIHLLLDYGADPNQCLYKNNKSGLFFCRDLECIKLLLDYGAHMDHQTSYGNTLLSQSRDEKVVNYLLQRGADPTLRNKRGEDAFTFALRENRTDLIRMLILTGRFPVDRIPLIRLASTCPTCTQPRDQYRACYYCYVAQCTDCFENVFRIGSTCTFCGLTLY